MTRRRPITTGIRTVPVSYPENLSLLTPKSPYLCVAAVLCTFGTAAGAWRHRAAGWTYGGGARKPTVQV